MLTSNPHTGIAAQQAISKIRLRTKADQCVQNEFRITHSYFNMITIRHSLPKDLDAMIEIFHYARQFKEHGNPNEWINGYPLPLN